MGHEMVVPRGDNVVVGVGATSALGLNALQTVMGIRAGRLYVRPTPFIDKYGDEAHLCTLGCLSDDWRGNARLAQLARRALLEAVQPWQRTAEARVGHSPPLPLMLAVPGGALDPRALLHLKDLLAEIASLSDGVIDVGRSQLFTLGRAGGIAALARAEAILASGAEAVIVGGVDTYFDPDALERLDVQMRLHGPNTENGLIPGEAAAFFVLTRRSRASQLKRYLSIVGHALEQEPRPYGHPEPCHALGMTLALNNAAGAMQNARSIDWQLSDVVYERHRVQEWQYAMTRAFQHFAEEVAQDQPLNSTGDVGAAALPLLVVIAAIRWATGCGAGDSAMLAVHSDGPERGALLIAREAAA